MRKGILIISIVAVLLITGCSLFQTKNNDIYPLAVGNYWNSKMVNQTFLGDSIVNDTTIHIRREIVNKVTLGNNKEAYKIQVGATDSLFNFALMGNMILYIGKADTAYFQYDSLNQSNGNYMAPKEIDIGSSWDTDTSHIEVIAIEHIEVPAGIFDAYRIASVVNNDTTWQWFANGVGLIKMYFETTIDSITKSKSTMELDSYSVK